MMPAMDRTALITGGSGGLGRAVVATFAANGWRVVVPDANPVPLEDAEVVEADLTEPGDVERAIRAAAAREETHTIAPPPASTSTGSAACVTR